MDGLIKNLIEPARSEEDLPVSPGSKVIDSSNIDEYVSDMKSKGLWE